MQEKSNRQNWLLLLGWVVFFQFMAGLSSLVSGKSSWYMGLFKSSWTPPGYVFGVVWTILYILLAVYAWSLSQIVEVPAQDRRLLQRFFALQMLVNFSWSPIFFGLQQVTVALLLIVVMIVLTVTILVKSIQHRVLSGYLLIPYLLWLGFAAYLTAVIVWLNG